MKLYAIAITALAAWLLWQGRIRPALMSRDDIRRQAEALAETFGPSYAAMIARQEEAAEAAVSNDYQSRIWGRVRRELEGRG